MICNKCNGKGVYSETTKAGVTFINICCEKCDQTGEVDWIENILGKHKLSDNNKIFRDFNSLRDFLKMKERINKQNDKKT